MFSDAKFMIHSATSGWIQSHTQTAKSSRFINKTRVHNTASIQLKLNMLQNLNKSYKTYIAV